MTDRVLRWTLPDVGPRQAELEHTIIDFRADPSLVWTAFDPISVVGEQKFELFDVAPGSMFYRFTAVDVEGTPDPNPPEVTADIVPFDPPGSITGITITDT